MIDTVVLDQTKQVARIIHLHPALALLSEQAQARIASASTVQKYESGECVSIPAKHFAIVGSGLIKSTVFIERRSVECIVNLAGPGETLELFRSRRATKHTVVTQSAVIVYVNGTAFSAEMPAAMRGMLNEYNEVKERAIDRLLAAIHCTAEGCIALALVDLQERYGDERDDGSAFIPLHFTRAELAALAGTSTETVIRTLTTWARAGLVISTPEGAIEIRNLGELQKIARAL